MSVTPFSGVTDKAPASPAYFNSKFSEIYTALSSLDSVLNTGTVNTWLDVVRDYGATGNGVTDDTSAIQSALSAVMVHGGTVVFPALLNGSQATYRVTAKLRVNSGSFIDLRSIGIGSATIQTSFANDPTLEITTPGSHINLQGLTFYGSNQTGSSQDGHAVAIFNTNGGSAGPYTPQDVSIKDCYFVGYRGQGKDENGSTMTAAGLYHVNGTVCYLENTIFYRCGYGSYFSGLFKYALQSVTVDSCDNAGIFLKNCENINFHGVTLNSCGSGGVDDGCLTIRGSNNISHFGGRYKNSSPMLLNCQDSATVNHGIRLYGCSMQQLDTSLGTTFARFGTGNEGIIIDGCDFKAVSSMTDVVGIDLIQAVAGYDLTSVDIRNNTFEQSSGAQWIACVRSNVGTNNVRGLRITDNQFGLQQALPSLGTIQSAVSLGGNIRDFQIASNVFATGSLASIVNGINFTSATVTDGILTGNSFRTTAIGSIVNTVNNAGGASYIRYDRDQAAFHLGQKKLLSVRTLAASAVTVSAANTNVTADEMVLTVGGASGASLAIHSGGTVYLFHSTTSARAT